MAKLVQKEKITKKNTKRFGTLSLEKINYLIILAGGFVIVTGYIALSTHPWDNPIALTVAPVLLVLGYCVIIPFGIIFRKKKNEDDNTEQQLAGQS